ncbi:MAG: hypothetical protein RI568_13635 [Natronomonas sp.]|uniref:hypothetical protein n=1 Tax=Natronomonas sp. TaxID=2184060 RepID=UPI002870A938|nr:hypothetical protein [Natronomonas sp.]MDR9431724.1 hypothetical protein [Natronomonas sp.]
MNWGTYFRRAWAAVGTALIGVYGVYAAAIQGELMYGSISALLVIAALSLARIEYQNITAPE